MASSPDIATLSINDFEPHLNAVFEIRSQGGIVPLNLDRTESCGQAIREGGAFSLPSAGPLLLQAIDPLQRPALGTLEPFLVPVGPVPGGNGRMPQWPKTIPIAMRGRLQP